MDDRRVADYFVIAGLPDNPLPLDDFSRDGASLKATHNQAPIIDVAVIFPSLGEEPPQGYSLVETTPMGFPANLNHGSLRSPSVFLCYRRGRDKAPLVDIGVFYEGTKEKVQEDCSVIHKTPYDRCANVNNSGAHTYITYRRASESDPCNVLVVTDVCVILHNKGEHPPRTFCKIDKDLNRSLVGSNVFLCYKKSMNRANSIAYKPATLGRFPLSDMPDFPLPDSVPLFCLPMGSTIECWPSKAGHPEPVFSTFVLTVSDAVEKVYGAAVTFYEQYPEEKLSAEEKLHLGFTSKSEQTVNVNKSMCILSHWPFFDTFERFLMYLHNMSVSGPHSIPIERYVSHFIQEIPFPSPQRPRILIQLEANEIIVLAQFEDSPLPLSGASFTEFLKTLGPENCLAVLLFALTEQKLLVHSLRPAVLTSVAEVISMLIFPFHWQCPYIPLCPLGLSDVLSAPMPYIVGVDSRYFDMYDPPSDVYCINLDTNTISNCDDRKPLNIKLLPKKPVRVLEKTLTNLFLKLRSPLYSSNSCLKNKPIKTDADLESYFKMKKFETMIETEIQEAFLRFMAAILMGFRGYLLPITRPASIGSTDPNSLFDIHGFLKSRDKAHHRFYTLLMKTQMFTRFIEERSFVTDKDASLAFFDECTEKVDNGDGREVRLIESDESHKSERTVYVPLPEMTGLAQGASYSYERLGKLNPALFHNKQSKHFLSVSNRASPAPSSPMARRTKQEIRSAQKLAQKHSKDPREWVKCLKSYCFCLWFIHLPAYVKETRYKCKTLKTAFEVLLRMQYFQLQPFDEVCYRVLMQLCGQYGEPVLAIKLLSNMKNSGVQPNAITYGYYNKAVLESKWPSQNTKNELWSKLRYAVLVVGQFRRNLKLRPTSVYSESDGASSESGIPDEGCLVTKVDCGQAMSKTEDHESGQSDVGYSSLILDETQQSSLSLNSGSQARSSSTGSDKVEELICKPEKAPTNGPISNSLTKLSKNESRRKCVRNLNYDEIDFSECNAFRARNGSIVRSSACILANHNTINAMRGSATVNSSAGLLIPGHAIYDDDVFLGELEENNKESTSLRKRHRTSESEKHDNDSGCMRNNSGAKPSPYGPSPQTSQECDSSTELLRSGSYGSDARILSHLSKSSSDEIDVAAFNEDDALHSRISVKALEGDTLKEKENLCSNEDDCLMSPSGERSPNIPIRSSTRSSSVTSPTLTPVTQNDPLGVFSTSSPLNSLPNLNQDTRILPSVSLECPASVGSSDLLIKEMLSPELFRNEPKRRTINMGRSRKGGSLMISGVGIGFPRSASFCTHSPQHSPQNAPCLFDQLGDSSKCGHGAIHRSNTVPDTAGLIEGGKLENAEGNPMSPLYTQWSSLTSRLQALTPSRKPDSALFGSVQAWKSVITSKLSEIKESISSKSFPNTPIKTNQLPKPYEMENRLLFDEDEEEGVEQTCQVNADFLPKSGKPDKAPGEEIPADQRSSSGTLERPRVKALGSLPYVGSEPVLGSSECLSESGNLRLPSFGDAKKVTSTTALEIQMTSCSRCHSCQGLLYDEEIMTNWSAEESDLNTRCAFCKSKMVPVLTVIVKDYRSESLGQGLLSPAQSIESMQSAQSLSTLSMCPSRKTSISSHQEPLFTLEDSPESTSVTSSVNSPVGSPQKQPSYLHQGVCAKNCCVETQDSGPVSKSHLTPHTDFDASSAKKLPLTIVNGGSASNVSEVVLREGFKGRVSELQTSSLPSSITSSTADICSDTCVTDAVAKEPNFVPIATLDPIIVPYLSPIVLRKELETVLDDEGDISLTQSEFVDKHPIIFWNLLWYCTRINVPTHLPGLCLKAKAVNKDRPVPKNWALANSHNVLIRCMWDNPKLHEEMGQAMYMTWNTTQSSMVNALVTEPGSINRGVIQQIISGIQCDDVSSPLKIIISELRKRRTGVKTRHYSIYRDLLFLCISYIGRQNINLVAFDREYRRAFRQLTPSQRHLLQRYDYPPTDGAVLCRQFFGSLEL